MPLLGPLFEPRDTAYQTGSSALISARTRTSPQHTSTALFHGRPGEKFRIDHRSCRNFDLQHTVFTLIFGSAYCKAAVTSISRHGEHNVYTLSVDVPGPDVSHPEPNKAMPLLLDITDDRGETLELENYGDFEYLSPLAFPPFSPLPGPAISRKRKLAQDATAFVQPLSKRAASQPIQPRYTLSEMSPGVQAPYSGAGHYFDSNVRYALPSGGFDRHLPQHRMYGAYPPPPLPTSPYNYAASPTVHNPRMRSPTAGSQSSYGTMRATVSPRVTRTPRVSSGTVVGSPLDPVQPPLIRTSILQQGGAGAATTRDFNPYANYPEGKAQLVLQGNLMAMTENWRAEERDAHRRLVEFTRSQSGSVVTATFKPVLPEERNTNSACISCIWWEEKDSYYVTSVDTIALLESLIAARFTVEEKNRIRRNLEALRPDTISKLKEDTDSFFRLIMSFPNPKPRNIEKDVKVFAWSDLEKALGKIFGKYVRSRPLASGATTHAANICLQSASFSSTVSHLVSPNQGGTAAAAEASAEQRPTASPRSITGSTASLTHAPSMTSTALSPSMGGSAGQSQLGMAQGEAGLSLPGSSSVAMVSSAGPEFRSMLGMNQMISGPPYGQYMGQYPSPTTTYELSMATTRPPYPPQLHPYAGQGAASPTGYPRPVPFYDEESRAEADAKGPPYSPYQATTSG